MKFIICLLFSTAAFSQSKPLELKIDNITYSTNADNEREYIIEYHIKNLSNNEVTFLLDTKAIIPINGGSLRPKPYYKIYENDKEFGANDIFSSKNAYLVFKSEEAFKKYQDSVDVAEKDKTHAQILSERKKQYLSYIKKMAPNETINLKATISWNKQRYHKDSTFEYYIQENEKYWFELHINLMKEEPLLDLTQAERNEILKDLNLIKGWYTSNKVPIDFNE